MDRFSETFFYHRVLLPSILWALRRHNKNFVKTMSKFPWSLFSEQRITADDDDDDGDEDDDQKW